MPADAHAGGVRAAIRADSSEIRREVPTRAVWRLGGSQLRADAVPRQRADFLAPKVCRFDWSYIALHVVSISALRPELGRHMAGNAGFPGGCGREAVRPRPWLIDAHPGGHVDHCAGDRRGVIGGQEDRRLSNVVKSW